MRRHWGVHPVVVADNIDRTTASATFGGKAKRRRELWRLVKIAACVFALLIVALYVGIDHPQEDKAQYCNNVREGVWPDYEGTFAAECGGENPPAFNANITRKPLTRQ